LPEIGHVHSATYRAHLNALTYYALGRKKESDAALSELITKYHASNASEIATIYAFRNQSDDALELTLCFREVRESHHSGRPDSIGIASTGH
jgi:hypothetical protein